MSYLDEEIVVDRQMLIKLANNVKPSFNGTVGYGAIMRKIDSSGICVFDFKKSIAWDDGQKLTKFKGPHTIELRKSKTFKLPDQSEFEYSVVTICPDIKF